MSQKAESVRVELAVLPAEDPAAGDAPGAVVTVRCCTLPAPSSSQPSAALALPLDGMRTASDAKRAADGDWRTATLRFGEAYPAESPCVEFSSSAAGFGNRQVIGCAIMRLIYSMEVISKP